MFGAGCFDDFVEIMAYTTDPENLLIVLLTIDALLMRDCFFDDNIF